MTLQSMLVHILKATIQFQIQLAKVVSKRVRSFLAFHDLKIRAMTILSQTILQDASEARIKVLSPSYHSEPHDGRRKAHEPGHVSGVLVGRQTQQSQHQSANLKQN